MTIIRLLGAATAVLALASAAAATQIVLPPRSAAKAALVVDETGAILMGGNAARVKTVDASEMVSVMADESSPTCVTGGFKFNINQGIDGSTGLFVIPAGKVLVITAFDWFVLGGTPSTTGIAQIVVESLGGATTPFVSVGMFDSGGAGGGQTTVPSGFPVRGGSAICVNFTNLGSASRGFLHGYLAADE